MAAFYIRAIGSQKNSLNVCRYDFFSFAEFDRRFSLYIRVTFRALLRPSKLRSVICIDGVTVGPSEAEYYKSLADPEEGASAGLG
jgi:hypothetical protein